MTLKSAEIKASGQPVGVPPQEVVMSSDVRPEDEDYKSRVREALDVLENYTTKDGKIDATKLTRRIAALEAELYRDNLCNVCAGDPASVNNCICGGTGTIHGEAQGLREYILKLEAELATAIQAGGCDEDER